LGLIGQLVQVKTRSKGKRQRRHLTGCQHGEAGNDQGGAAYEVSEDIDELVSDAALDLVDDDKPAGDQVEKEVRQKACD
jgi:hypothetical protein